MSPTPTAAPLGLLHVITDLRVGGAEMQLLRCVQGMQALGQSEVRTLGVVCLRAGGPVADRLESAGVRVWRLGASGPVSFVRAATRLRRILQQERPDAVCAWLYHAMLALALPGVVPAGVARIWNVRGTVPTSEDRRGTRVAFRLARVASSGVSAIVYNAHTARAEHEKAGYAEAHGVVIPNGYEVPAVDPGGLTARDGGKPPRVLLPARFHRMKDFGTFLAALEMVVDRIGPVSARLVGEGCEPGNEELQALVQKSGCAPFVEFGGVRNDMAAEYRWADVVCSSSAWGEGFQNVLAEAALAGRLVVSTDVGDASRIVGEEGYVVPSRSPALLAEALSRALALGEPERSARARRLRDRVAAAYSVETMSGRYRDLVKDVAGSERRS